MGVPLGAAMSSPRWKFSPPKICRPPKGEVIRPRRGQRNRPYAPSTPWAVPTATWVGVACANRFRDMFSRLCSWPMV